MPLADAKKYKHDDVSQAVDEFMTKVDELNYLLDQLRDAGIYVNMETKSNHLHINNIRQTVDYYHAAEKFAR